MHTNGQNKYHTIDPIISESNNHEDEIDLLKLLNILLLNKWILLVSIFVGSISAISIAIYTTPIYMSKGSIFVSETKNSYSYAGSDLSSLLTSSYGIGAGSTIANELQIFKSRKLSTDLAQHLFEQEYMTNGIKFPVLWRSYPEDSSSIGVDTVAQRLRMNLEFDRPDPSADVISISYESVSPEEAAYIVNLTMDTYSQLSTAQNRIMAVSALQFLSSERQNIEDQLNVTEEQLRDFMNTNKVVSITPQAEQVINSLAQLEGQKQELTVRQVAVNSAIEQYEDQLNEIKPGLADQFSEATASILRNYQFALAELETQRLLLTTKNPDIKNTNPDLMVISQQIDAVKEQIRTLANSIIEDGNELALSFLGSNEGNASSRIAILSEKLIELKVEHTQMETQSTVINERIGALNLEFNEFPDDMIDLARLQRDVNINEELFMIVSSQFAEMSLWEKTQFGLGRPLDYAVPADNPIKPEKKLIAVLGFLLGGIFGVGIIFIKEILDNTIKSTDDIKNYGIPVLGTIPDFSILEGLDPSGDQFIDNKSISNQLITFIDHISPISEAYRRLRINVIYANPDKAYKVIMVTSATKGEGKSTVAANLAVTFSEAEKTVLIIDLDLRRPTQHKIFGENREPGLTDSLFETIKISDITNTTIAPNVDLITVGKKTPEPATVLDSKRLKQLIDKLSERYDHVILDTAPYGIISDSASLLRLVDGIVVVSRFNVTTKRELSFTLEGLAHLNADVLGIVLNAFDPKKSTDYYTNYSYYKRTYSDYYQEDKA